MKQAGQEVVDATVDPETDRLFKSIIRKQITRFGAIPIVDRLKIDTVLVCTVSKIAIGPRENGP